MDPAEPSEAVLLRELWALDARLEEALEDSFPASDPVAVSRPEEDR